MSDTCTNLIDSYSETNKDGSTVLRINHPSAIAANSARGQCFFTESNEDLYLCKVKFYLSRNPTPDGNLKAYLYEITGTYGTNAVPTGAPLAMSNAVPMSSVGPLVTFSLITFTFPSPRYRLQASHHYAIAVVVLDCTTCDADNNIEAGFDFTAPSHGGNAFYYRNGGWISVATHDTCFYVYGEYYGGGPYLPFDEDKIHAKTESPKCVKPFNLPYARMSENLSVICKAAFDATYDPWEWWIDDDGELNFNERRGTDKSATIRFIARDVIPTSCDVHMGDTSKSIDSKRSVQKIKLTGKSEGKRQDEVSSNWQLDDAVMKTIGTFYEEVISEKTVTGRETINDWARVYLQKLKDAIQEIEVTIERDPYISGSWDVADDVWLYDPKSRITAAAYRIKRVNYRIDGAGGEHLVLTVTNSWQDITDAIADIYRKIKQIQMTGMGVEDWTAGGTDQGKGQAQKMENLWSINKEYENANEFGEPKEDDPNNSDSYWCNAGYPNVITGEDIRVRQDELTMEGSDTNNSAVQRTTAITTRMRMTDWDESPRFHVRLVLKSLDNMGEEREDECMQSTDDWIKFGIINSQSGNPASLVMFRIECNNVGAQTYDVIAMANFNNSGLIQRTVKEIVAGEMHEYEARVDWKSRYVLYYIDNLPVAVIPIDTSCYALDIDDMELMYIRADMTSSEAYQPVLEFYTWKTQCEIVGKYDQSSS